MNNPREFHKVKNGSEYLSLCGYDDPKHILHEAKNNIATLIDLYAAMRVQLITEELKQKFCVKTKEVLTSVSLMHFHDSDGDNLPLIDLLSTNKTIQGGRDEIDNIVDCIYLALEEV